MIERPKKVHFDNDTRISTLYFDDQVQGDYFMRGGICWPVMTEAGGVADVYGYAIMAGQDVESKQITIFEQQKYEVIDNILRPDKTIEFHGLAPWFNKVWARYFGGDYFYNQDWQLSRIFTLEVIRSDMINPKPQFILIEWKDIEDARHLLWQQIKFGKLRIEEDSELFRQIRMEKHGEKTTLPAVHALMCCICGFERYPFRKY